MKPNNQFYNKSFARFFFLCIKQAKQLEEIIMHNQPSYQFKYILNVT